jgi:16S rRNA processing protein RimM
LRLSNLNESDWVSIGVVTSTHGLNGAIKVYPLTDFLSRFNDLKEVYLLKADRSRCLVHVNKVMFKKGLVILGFEEITRIDQAEELKGAYLQVGEDQTAPLPEDTYYVFQIIGLEVWTTDEQYIGEVIDVINNQSANDVYVVKTDPDKTILLPAIKQVIKKIDIPNRRIWVELIDGLL